MTKPTPLEGLRIIDMSAVVMGPFAAQILGDLGADVIKVEPHAGDTTRHVTPMRNKNMGWVYLHANRNKRSLVLDLKDAEGKAAFLKLAEISDAIITAVGAGVGCAARGQPSADRAQSGRLRRWRPL
jgi:crotonobetainyl-CoA:carnitine CoA-transferase CaiB-like acyl-CoA transferase